ncbi:MAG: STAS domain-containing protein [Chitinivibrionales bacterium]
MRLETYPKGDFQILRIGNKSAEIDSLDELEDLVTGYLSRGRSNIAISFGTSTYICGSALRVLKNCHTKIIQNGGNLCIIEPDPQLFDILEMLNRDGRINIYVGEEFLPAVRPERRESA